MNQPGPIEQTAASVIDQHLIIGPRTGQCMCGWGDGTDIRTLGQPHSQHLVEQLRAAGVLKDVPRAPKYWLDLIEALTILARHPSGKWPTYCAHDTLHVAADPTEFTAEEIARLEELGFLAGDAADMGGFYSHQFGSC